MTQASSKVDVETYLSTLKREVDGALDGYSNLSKAPRRLCSAMRYSLLASGKRLRPCLALIASELCGTNRAQAIPAAVALEFVHTYSLIHDDLPAMDDDDLRRGRPTCHRQFDEATAILAGDGLLTGAFEVLASSAWAPEVVSRCVATLARAAGAVGMVGGQADDVDWASSQEDGSERANRSESENFLNAIHRRKTGALISASLQLGGIVARASDDRLKVLEEFGYKWGLAFQISDDLLDVLGDEQTVGKRLHKDEEAGKLTYASLWGVEETRRRLEKTTKEAENVLRDAKGAFDVESLPFKTLLYLTEYVARRDK